MSIQTIPPSRTTATMQTTQGIALLNAISISMMPNGGFITITPIDLAEARTLAQQAGVKSYIGHPATAQLVSTLLGVNVPANREMFIAKEPTVALVVAILERLPEGKILSFDELMQLYDSGKIRFYLVNFNPMVSTP